MAINGNGSSQEDVTFGEGLCSRLMKSLPCGVIRVDFSGIVCAMNDIAAEQVSLDCIGEPVGDVFLTNRLFFETCLDGRLQRHLCQVGR